MDPSIDWLEIGYMDRYFSRESDDHIVPNTIETPEVLCEDAASSLPNGWLQRAVTTPKNFKSPNKNPSIAANEPTKEFNLGNSDAYWHGSRFLDGWPDYQLQNLFQSIDGSGNIEQMDEIFLNSLLEDDSPDMENPYCPVGRFLNTECSSTPVENLLTGILLDSESIKKKSSCMGSSKYLKTSGFPTAMDDISVDWDKKEDCSPIHCIPSDFGRIEGPPPVDEHLEEECLEAAVLQELKDTTLQLNQKTRICFRDALYRLAKSSKQKHSADHSSTEVIVEEPSITSIQNKRARHSNGSMKLEPATNAIDRTIINLLFREN